MAAVKKRRAFACVLCAAVLLSSVLCGCDIGPHSIESLMRPPHAGSERELEKALDSILGSGFSLRAPQSGDYHTAVTRFDLNGDGQQEALVFYSRATDSVRLCVLRQNAGSWEKVNDFPGDGSGVYSLSFDDMNDDGFSEIFVGWYLFNDKSKKALTVYSTSANDGLSVSVCTTESYDHYVLTDVKNNGEKQLFIAYADVSKTPIAATLKRIGMDAAGHVFTAGSLPMDPRIVRIDSLLFDRPKGEPYPRVFADALLSDNQMITEVFLWSEERNNYDCAFRQSDEGLNTETQRGGTLKSADVDDDGLIEIPLRKRFIQSAADEVAVGYLLAWCGVEGKTLTPRLYYAVNVAQDYRLFLPKEWNGKVFVHYTDAAHWEFVNGRGETLFSVSVQESASLKSNNATVTVLDDTSAPGMTYFCRVTEKGRAFGVTEEELESYFEYYAGGTTK